MLTPNGGVFGRNPTFNNVTVENNLTVNGDFTLGDDIVINDTLLVNGPATFNGGIISTGTAAADSTNTTLGSGAGAALAAASTDAVLIGRDAGDLITASNGVVAVGRNALGSFRTGAASITNTTPGTGGTPGTIAGVTLEKDSGTGTMVTYPTVTLTVSAGGAVTAITITNPGNGLTAQSGLVFKATAAGIALGAPADWRGTLAFPTGRTVAVGTNALSVHTGNPDSDENMAVGHQALESMTTGIRNTAVGLNAARLMTTGGSNVAIGETAMQSVTTGSSNVAVGARALRLAATNTGNTAIGAGALRDCVGDSNTCVGTSAGLSINTGASLTAATGTILIGRDARVDGNSQSNQIVIGTDGRGDGTNTTVLGNASTTQARIRGGNFLSTGANGQSTQLGQSTTLLSGLSGATVTATNLIPANCILLGVTARVTTAITGATTFDIGDGSTANRFGDDIAIALNTTANNCIAPALIAAATNVVLTANGSNFTAGAVRLTAHYITLVAPTA